MTNSSNMDALALVAEARANANKNLIRNSTHEIVGQRPSHPYRFSSPTITNPRCDSASISLNGTAASTERVSLSAGRREAVPTPGSLGSVSRRSSMPADPTCMIGQPFRISDEYEYYLQLALLQRKEDISFRFGTRNGIPTQPSQSPGHSMHLGRRLSDGGISRSEMAFDPHSSLLPEQTFANVASLQAHHRNVRTESMQRRNLDETIPETIQINDRRRKPNFAEKLHMVLSSKECRDSATWLPSGVAFCITDQALFTSKILPKFFREAKFESFSRRLKRWGFRKGYTPNLRQAIFSHEMFSRDRPDLCRHMNGREKVPQEKEGFHFNDGRFVTSDSSHACSESPSEEAIVQQKLQQYESEVMSRNNSVQSLFSMDMQSKTGRLPPPARPCEFESKLAPSALTSTRGSFSTAHISNTITPDTSDAQERLKNLEFDIKHCEEELAILQKLKMLKERRRMLTESAADQCTRNNPSMQS